MHVVARNDVAEAAPRLKLGNDPVRIIIVHRRKARNTRIATITASRKASRYTEVQPSAVTVSGSTVGAEGGGSVVSGGGGSVVVGGGAVAVTNVGVDHDSAADRSKHSSAARLETFQLDRSHRRGDLANLSTPGEDERTDTRDENDETDPVIHGSGGWTLCGRRFDDLNDGCSQSPTSGHHVDDQVELDALPELRRVDLVAQRQ